MPSLSLCPQFETNLMSNRKVIKFLLQSKSAMALGKNYIRVKAHLVRHLLRNRLFNHVIPCPNWSELFIMLQTGDVSLSYNKTDIPLQFEQ